MPEVAVWTLLPLFWKVTLPPCVMVTEAGLIPCSVIVTVAPCCTESAEATGLPISKGRLIARPAPSRRNDVIKTGGTPYLRLNSPSG